MTGYQQRSWNRSPEQAGEIEGAVPQKPAPVFWKMDPVITDRCVIVALSDAFGRFQHNRIPPSRGWFHCNHPCKDLKPRCYQDYRQSACYPRHYPLRLPVTRAYSYDTALSLSIIARAIRSYMQLIAAIVKMSSTRLDGPIGNTYESAITAIVPLLPPEGVYKTPLSRYLNRFQGQKQPLAVLAQG